MRARSRISAVVAAAGLALTGLAGTTAWAAPHQAAHTVRVRVTGIDRDGHKTAVYAIIYGTNHQPINAVNSKAVSVPTGPAWIGTQVLTLGPANVILSATLVMRHVSITRSQTIVLDARPGKLVKFSLTVPGAADTGDLVQACVGGGFKAGPAVSAEGAGGTVYVVPVRTRALDFGYQSTWQSLTASYLIAGTSRGGVPSLPHYRGAVSSMARVQFVFRGGEAAGGYSNASAGGSTGRCGVAEATFNPAPTGSSFTQYLPAGIWTAAADGHRAFWQGTRRFAARHSYTDTFGGAVWGPGQDFPSVQQSQLVLFPESPIGDPGQTGSECCDVSSITLSSGGHVLRHAVLSEWRATRAFTATLPSAAWYTMRISSWRRPIGLKLPADLLSPRDSLVWRFHARPDPTSSAMPLVPVTATRYLPQELNLQNQAAPDAATVLDLQVVRPRSPGFQSPPDYRLRTVQVQASFNDGKTWQPIKVTRQGNHWLATVHDPASGFVSLRSTVIDSAGDSTIQTIYRAYAIAG